MIDLTIDSIVCILFQGHNEKMQPRIFKAQSLMQTIRTAVPTSYVSSARYVYTLCNHYVQQQKKIDKYPPKTKLSTLSYPNNVQGISHAYIIGGCSKNCFRFPTLFQVEKRRPISFECRMRKSLNIMGKPISF